MLQVPCSSTLAPRSWTSPEKNWKASNWFVDVGSLNFKARWNILVIGVPKKVSASFIPVVQVWFVEMLFILSGQLNVCMGASYTSLSLAYPTICKAFFPCGARFVPSTNINSQQYVCKKGWECNYDCPKMGFTWTFQCFGKCILVIWIWQWYCLLCATYHVLSPGSKGPTNQSLQSLQSFDFGRATVM